MEIRKKNKGSKSKHCSYYLPPEIWTEHILSKAPVKTLLRFRSVCKLWCSTIDDPRFASDHFTLSNNNRDKNQLLAIENMGHRGKRGLRVTVRQSNTSRRRSLIFDSPEKRYHFQVGCNGLFFARRYWVTDHLKLWNPSLRKSLSFPKCPLVTYNAYVKYLFGFKSSINDYVLYAFRVDEYTPMKVSVAIYTLSDNIWRVREYTVSIPSWLFPEGRWFRDHEIMCGNEAVFLDGALHWFGSHPDADNRTCTRNSHLVSFDFNAEKFSYLELPDSHKGPEDWNNEFLFAFGGSLVIISITPESRSIWGLKNKVWVMWFLGLSSPVGYDYLPYYHRNVFTKVLCIEDGDITLVFGKIAYKIISNETKQVTKSLSSFLILDTYSESMVLHKGCEGQIITPLKLEQ